MRTVRTQIARLVPHWKKRACRAGGRGYERGGSHQGRANRGHKARDRRRRALTLEATTAPPASVLDVLARHKAGIVALLRDGKDGWSGEDWMAFFQKRAGSASGLPRDEAEVRAFDCCIVEWLNRNPVRSPSGRCLGCGGSEHAHDKLLPFGTEQTGHAWLHSRCWPAWQAARKAEAIAALAAMGIDQPRTNR
jgi:hypothetical protein